MFGASPDDTEQTETSDELAEELSGASAEDSAWLTSAVAVRPPASTTAVPMTWNLTRRFIRAAERPNVTLSGALAVMHQRKQARNRRIRSSESWAVAGSSICSR